MEYLERESKWEIGDDVVLPRFDDLRAGCVVRQSTTALVSTYYDTVDGDLHAQAVTLRRRDGDDEQGWQLKVPESGGRRELTTELSDEIPAELSDLVRGIALGKPLQPVATIHTTRQRYRLLTAGELVWAEVDDDLVQAERPANPGEVFVWREIEVEAGPGAESVPDEIVARLVETGAVPARSRSKLGRVLGADTDAPDQDAAPAALIDYVRDQIDAIIAGDIALRRGHDPIHDTRVAIRRLRSTLRVFGPQFESTAIEGVGDELRWYAALLGEVRDCQVQRRRFADAVAALDSRLVVGPVDAGIDEALAARQAAARAQVRDAMDSPRYLNLLAALRRWQRTPPLAAGITPKALRKRTARAGRKADHRLAAALDTGDDRQLHRARKAAKRARYAAELARAVQGKSMKKKVKHYKRIQRILGEHQDSVVAASTLLDLASRPGATTPTFTYGVLYAAEVHAAQGIRRTAGDL